MYLSFYGLKKEPFHNTPDPSFLYLSPQHKEALGAIIYGIEKRKGFIAILGEVGVGKTTILRAYLERKATRKQKTIYIFNPVLTYHGLLIAIFRSLELTPRYDDVAEMVNQLHEALIAEYQSGGTVVLAIDEAQNMPIETLENLRMISNLESSTDKLIQIILLGQPELNTMLEQPSLRQFRQRIALRATISPLSEEESRRFIEHRIKLASASAVHSLFTKSALNLIVRQAQGIPRRINILCDNALITGFGRQSKPVPVNVVKEIIRDIDNTKVGYSNIIKKWAIGLGLAAVLIISIAFIFELIPIPFNLGKQALVHQSNPGPIGNNASLNARSSEVGDTVISDESKNPQNKINTVSDDISRNQEKEVVLQKPSEETENSPSLRDDQIDKSKHNSHEQMGSLSIAGGAQLESHSSVAEIVEGKKRINGEKASLEIPKTAALPVGADADISIGGSSIEQLRVIRTVKAGENLSQIAGEVYGSHNEKVLKWVKQHNPHIVDPNFILPGQNIVLPEYRNE